MKALGTGWNHGVRWRDCEVARMPGGRPTMAFHGTAGEFAAKLGVLPSRFFSTPTWLGPPEDAASPRHSGTGIDGLTHKRGKFFSRTLPCWSTSSANPTSSCYDS
jgi:hypothetical protein